MELDINLPELRGLRKSSQKGLSGGGLEFDIDKHTRVQRGMEIFSVKGC